VINMPNKKIEELQEHLDDSTMPLEVRKKLLLEIHEHNLKFGAYKKFIKNFDDWLKKNNLYQKKIKILELGPGAGGMCEALHNWGKEKDIELELHGLDVSQDITDWQKSRLSKLNISFNTHLAGDQYLKQFSDNKFDFVISFHVLHHIHPYNTMYEALRDSLRVSRKGLFAIDIDKRPFTYTLTKIWNKINGISEMLNHDGLVSVKRSYKRKDMHKTARRLSQQYYINYECKRLFLIPYYRLGLCFKNNL